MLRKAVARIVCWLVAALFLVLPIITTLLNRILQFERQHQVTERVISNGFDLTSALGERGLEVQRSLLRLKQSPAGAAFMSASTWVMEGLVGGVNDGFDAVARERLKSS